MGDCKSQMASSDKKQAGSLGSFFSKKKKTDPDHKETFADLIERSDSMLANLILVKEQDLLHEKGKEVENRRSLSILRSMEFHLNQIGELGALYLEGK